MRKNRYGPHDLADWPAARANFRAAIFDPNTGVGRLVDWLMDRSWPQFPGPTVYRLAGDDLAELKAEVIRRVEVAGGALELTRVTLRVADGKLSVELPRTPRATQ